MGPPDLEKWEGLFKPLAILLTRSPYPQKTLTAAYPRIFATRRVSVLKCTRAGGPVVRVLSNNINYNLVPWLCRV